MSNHVNFTAVNAVVDQLKHGRKSKRELSNLLSNNFTMLEVDKAIHAAVNIKVARVSGLIKPVNHEQTIYMEI